MKVKNSFWALAFALMAVSCSDDIEGGPNGNNGNGAVHGETAKISVTVNASTRTKAETLEEGSKNESEVKELILVLYNNETGGSASTNDFDFKATSKIVAVGHTDQNISNNHTGDQTYAWKAEVEVEVTDNNDALVGNKFGVIAITNVDETSDLYKKLTATDNTKIDTGEKLGDALMTTVYNKTNNTNFVMSTHMVKNTNVEYVSTVTPTSSETPAEVTVYVERLAAKIRINEQEADNSSNIAAVDNFFYSLKEKEVEIDGQKKNITDKVLLNKVAVVNQLTSGSYLIKRVATPDQTTEAIPATDENDTYLGAEESDAQGAIAYVIDPWTRSKTKANLNSLPSTPAQLAYTNRYAGNKTFEQLFGTGTDIYSTIQLGNNTTDFTDTKHQMDLCYTMENTLDASNDFKGYATGAVFQATYFPGAWVVADETKGGTKAEAVTYGDNNAAATADSEGKDFYANDNIDKPVIYKDLTAVFASYVANAKDLVLKDQDKSQTIYTKFNSTNITSITVENFKKSVFYKSAGDPLGYIAYLNKKIDDGAASFTADDSFDNYIANEESWNATKKATVYKEIKPFKKGACVYDYWIKHIPGDSEIEAGVMEYGIVRNNIYDMTVQSISGLGLSMINIPDGEEEIKRKELRMNVTINVKNWVVRNNGGIIL